MVSLWCDPCHITAIFAGRPHLYIRGKVLVIRDQEAYDKAQAKRQRALDAKVSIAVSHLPRIILTKYDGVIRASDRDTLRDMLIKDGVLGARWNAKHIANAKKYGKPLNQWECRTAEAVVDGALAVLEKNGTIAITSELVDRHTPELIIRHMDNQQQHDESALKDAHLCDPDEQYPLAENLPRHRAEYWNLRYAHE